jgi:hypothetical protein
VKLARAERVGVTNAKFHLVKRDPKRTVAELLVDPQAEQVCLR